jgi:hypothetical protein
MTLGGFRQTSVAPMQCVRQQLAQPRWQEHRYMARLGKKIRRRSEAFVPLASQRMREVLRCV